MSCSVFVLQSRLILYSQAVAQAFALIFSYCNPLMLNAWEVKTGYFYCGLAAIGMATLYFIMPEVSVPPVVLRDRAVDPGSAQRSVLRRARRAIQKPRSRPKVQDHKDVSATCCGKGRRPSLVQCFQTKAQSSAERAGKKLSR